MVHMGNRKCISALYSDRPIGKGLDLNYKKIESAPRLLYLKLCCLRMKPSWWNEEDLAYANNTVDDKTSILPPYVSYLRSDHCDRTSR